MSLKDEVYNYIKKYQHVSFAELTKHVPGFGGELAWTEEKKNQIYWHNMSDEAIDAMIELLDEGRIKPHSTSILVYMCDGIVPNLPIATSPKRTYKKWRWLPMTFSTY